jgi:hypothetical protein
MALEIHVVSTKSQEILEFTRGKLQYYADIVNNIIEILDYVLSCEVFIWI